MVSSVCSGVWRLLRQPLDLARCGLLDEQSDVHVCVARSLGSAVVAEVVGPYAFAFYVGVLDVDQQVGKREPVVDMGSIAVIRRPK